MSNTYSQIYIQIVFAVKGRRSLISFTRREELHRYITDIVKSRGQKMLAIFSMPDHTHILIGLSPAISVSVLVRDIKAGSSKFINDSQWLKGKFNWQEGYGAFSYSRDQVDQVAKYILNQEDHHRSRTFKEEYLTLLADFEITFNTKYLFDWME